MIKKLISAAIMMTALTAWVSAASAAELYISSDTTDKYNEYEKLVNEYFSEIDEYRKLSDFEITGKYDFSDTGINFSGNEKSSLMINKELGDDYVINTCVTAENGVRVIYSYIDESNYAYLESDSTLSDCDIRLAEVKNGVQSVIASGSIGKLSEIKTSVGDGKINVSCIFDGTVTEVFSEVPVSVTGGKAGLEFVSASGSVKLIEVWQKREECYNGSIDGCIVSYENLGKCTFIAAFYNNGTLDSVYSTEVNITDKGNNYISLPINNIHSLQGLEQKFFLFDSWSNINPLVNTENISSYREGLSDELEPYYRHPTAVSLTTTDMVKRIRGGKLPGAELADEDLTEDELPGGERYEVVDMYRKAGIDLSLNLETYAFSSILTRNMPREFSHLTPQSLTGDYVQPYSVDACWNNKIPEDNPSMLLGSWNNMDMNIQIGTVKNKMNSDGNGIGIPYIIGEKDAPEYTLLCKYNTNVTGLHGHLIKGPENLIEYTNYQTTSDNHAIFINGDTKTSVQSMGIRPPGYAGGYSILSGLVLNFDARANKD